ncbi:MAG TPA: pyrroloquinoline quinone biosynthesis protein PqqE [Alphaproteobacteria bacterium]|nr:pyrroloquinoline quinone biosynthesis protein PqqE [Alphaproteobacteria bacterium]
MTPSAPEPPLALLAELTHRCPLQCPYCSNPLALERAASELDTATWCRVFDEAAALGILQVHFSGGEPAARKDLEALVAHAAERGLYTNLITSAVLLDAGRIERLVKAGLNHVQISVQDHEPRGADRIGGYAGAHAKKLAVARLVRAAGLPLTLNAVMHRQNLDHLEAMIELAVSLGAARLEVAHTQYYGWGLRNRAALIPTRAQLERATEIITAARQRLKGRLVIDYVVPDYYARRPKSCMGGWARRFLNITPAGKVLPCHAAETIAELSFESVTERPLAAIWRESPAFERFRGTSWMPEPCRSCDRREIDWGGCRCQALAIAGHADAVDPACEMSPLHERLAAIAAEESAGAPPEFVYRRIGAIV